jgi:hypothetical protein
MDTKEVLQSITTLFSEAYAGPVDLLRWFIDNERGRISGLFQGLRAEATVCHRNQPGVPLLPMLSTHAGA